MTNEELYKIAYSNPILTDKECENDLTNNDISSICDEAYNRFIKLSQDDGFDEEDTPITVPRINNTEYDWITLEQFSKELENEIRKMYR